MSSIPSLSAKEFAYAVFGMLMGDGHLAKNKVGQRVYFVCEHGPKQDGYARYKAEFLKQHSRYVTVRQVPTQQHGGVYVVTRIRARFSPAVLRHMNKFDRIYTDDGKVFSKYVARRITALGLLFWFMDDGTASVTRKKSRQGSVVTSRTFRLGTHGFDEVSKRRITNTLNDRFSVSSKVIRAGGDQTLHSLGVSGMRQFIDAVRPHLSCVPKSMRYKFDMQYPDDPKYSRWSLGGEPLQVRNPASCG